jgi:hypothetical protein
MKIFKAFLCLILVLLSIAAVTGYALATPSSSLQKSDGDLFDDWDLCRTRSYGNDGFYQISEIGFRPAIAFESLGEHAALAYEMGRQFASEYPDQLQRAAAIFNFVRDSVTYTPDIDQFSYEEFAQNADELALAIREKGVGYGDCEDSAVLLAIMYKGAGYRSAIAVGEGHTASLVYLPDYRKANAVFEIDGESGWIWAEATGKNNPLGWAPKEFINVPLAAYEISAEAITPLTPAPAPSVAVTESGRGGSSSQPFLFFAIIGFLWLIPLFRRRKTR